MAMVTITRDGTNAMKRVSRSAYENLFKPRGYVVISDDSNNSIEENVETEENKESEEMEEVKEDIETVPLSEMNKEQLLEYAKAHNIDTSGAKNVRDARRIIQKTVQEERM